MEKRDDNPMNYDSSSSMSTGWQFASASVVNSSIRTAPVDVQLPVCRGDLVIASSGPSVSMAEAFGPDPRGHPSSSQSLGFCDINLPNASASSALGVMSSCPPLRSGNDGILEMGWNPSSSMLKGGIFLPAAPGILPQSLTHIPADSGFIERAARFSCFNSGNFNDLANPFQSRESVSPYSRGSFQGRLDVISSSGLNSVSRQQDPKGVINVAKASNEASSPISFMATKGSPLQIERRSEGLITSLDEGKQCAGGSGNDSVEAEFSGDPDETTLLEGNCGDSSAKSIGSKKRKRSGQGKGIQQLGEAAKDTPEIQPDQNPASAADKTAAKQGKQGSQASDFPKEEYIHVRARRGQATNSHSLAERVRREKISERMKFLQDLVPGCSKVTGKAVMLDEIINYVQSLQRQVEFLSMKLATVNPTLDFKLEGLLAKDILPPRAVPTPTLAFSADMSIPYPPLHPSQPGLIPAGFPSMETHADVLRRTVNTQLNPMAGEFVEHPQLLNAWDNDLHNAVQMSYGTNAPQDGQEANVSTPTEHMKVEQ